MQAKTERFEMRFDQATLETVDAWRARQGDFPSRAEAMRRLIDIGLAASSSPREIAISDGEKLILSLLSDVHKQLKISNGDGDPDFVLKAICGGHYWGLGWKYHGLLHGDRDNQHVVSEVVDVLDMWSFIESGYDKLSRKDKARIEAEAEPFGRHVRFRGFDGNNETEYMGVARFLIDDLERFSSFKDRELNSHMPSVETYRRMLRVFEPIRRNLVGRELGAPEIIALLNAMMHPDNRNKVGE
ncbi:MAG: YfbU family protein [Pseudolabrys sp.]